MIKKCQKKRTCFGATKSSFVSSIKLPDVDLLTKKETTNSFLFMCDLICVVVIFHVHVALGGSMEDEMIGHTKHCGVLGFFRLFFI